MDQSRQHQRRRQAGHHNRTLAFNDRVVDATNQPYIIVATRAVNLRMEYNAAGFIIIVIIAVYYASKAAHIKYSHRSTK